MDQDDTQIERNENTGNKIIHLDIHLYRHTTTLHVINIEGICIVSIVMNILKTIYIYLFLFHPAFNWLSFKCACASALMNDRSHRCCWNPEGHWASCP